MPPERSSTSVPRPSDLLRQHGLQAKKRWGQNFLHDPQVVTRIVEAADIAPGDTVVEIGAGLGALTGVLAARAARLIAIERDRDLARLLRERLASMPCVEIAEANALTYDFAALGRGLVVVGNLPYNIASPLIFHLLEQRASLRVATLMLQRELAQRLASPPGSRVYGAPSVIVQQYAEARVCLHVGRGAFTPPPRVDSTVVQLRFRSQALCPVDPEALQRVVHVAFAGRRKTLLRALSAQFPRPAVELALASAGIDPRARAETLGVAAFAQLAALLFAAGGAPGSTRMPPSPAGPPGSEDA